LIPLILAASLEGFLGYCLGCTVFGWLMRRASFPKRSASNARPVRVITPLSPTIRRKNHLTSSTTFEPDSSAARTFLGLRPCAANPPSPLARFGLQRRARRPRATHDERGRHDARVVVAGVAPVPANVTVVHQAITTTFDVTLVPRSSTDSPTTFEPLGHGVAELSPFLTTAQFAQRFGASAASVATVRDYFDGSV